MKSIFLTFILGLSFFTSQQTTVLEQDFDYFEVNIMTDIYTVKNNIITQFDKNGKQKFQYSNYRHGNVYSLDCSDPMRILAFYKEFNQVVFLDNTLSEISDFLNLDDIYVNETHAVCTSSTGGFWLFNSNQYKLQKYSKSLDLVQEGTNMEGVIDRNLNPDFLDEQGNNIYLGFKDKGVYVFDIFGTYKKFIPLTYTNSIQVINQEIYYYKDSVYKYNIKDFETTVLDIPIENFTSFNIINNSLYIGDNHKITKID